MSLTLDRERLGYRYEGPVLSRIEISDPELHAWIARWRDHTILLALDHSHLLAVPS